MGDRAAAVFDFRTIAAGFSASFVVTTDGTLWSIGVERDSSGVFDRDTPIRPVPILTDVAHVASSSGRLAAVRTDGTLWVGTGHGQGGAFSDAPSQVMTDVVQVATGTSHTVVLRTDRTVWTFGTNCSGELGHRGGVGVCAGPQPQPPTRVMTDALQVAAGDSHTLVLKADGTLWAFGSNFYGALGVSANSGLGVANPSPVLVMSDVRSIDAGGAQSMVIRNDGTLWTFGHNFWGELGTTSNNQAPATVANPTPTRVMRDVVRVSTGNNHTLVVTANGTLWGMGSNWQGQLGIQANFGEYAANPVPTRIMSGVVQVAAGYNHSLVVTNDGRVLAFGGNNGGQLGVTDNLGDNFAANRGMFDLAVGDGRPRMRAGQTMVVQVAGRGGVPSGAGLLAALNVTVADAGAAGYITVFPCDQRRPNASNVNYEAGASIPNLVFARPDRFGRVCIFTSATVDILVDVTGYFPTGSGYEALPNPTRLLDTRSGTGAPASPVPAGGVLELRAAGRAGIPADATAVVLNVTATGSRADGFVTVFPCDRRRPDSSNLNVRASVDIAGLVVARVDRDGRICLYTSASTELLADAAGYFAPGAEYVPIGNPTRILDTRAGNGAPAVPIPAGGTIELQVAGRAGIPSDARTVLVNLTSAGASSDGFVTVYPCGQTLPTSSNLNFTRGVAIANMVTAQLGAGGRICLYSSAPTDLIADVAGWFPGERDFVAVRPGRLADSRTGLGLR